MRNIELRVSLDDAYGRAAARGVIRYAKGTKDWKLYGTGRPFADARELAAAGYEGADGIIARIESAQAAKELAAQGVPIVDIAGAYPQEARSRELFFEVNNDDFLTGRRAGEYLRAQGFRTFAFCGVSRVEWSRMRRDGFAEACGIHRPALARFERDLDWWKAQERERSELASWLEKMERPTAVFACNDIAGLKVSLACTAAGLSVPEDAAILGVDDEDLLCELAAPSLSSLRLDCEGIGYEAARMLDEALRGEGARAAAGGTSRRVPPREVVERESTTAIVPDDPIVSRALSWIRAHAPKGANATDAAAAMPVCRRSLEQRFKAALGVTLHQAVVDARLDRAKLLLQTTDLPLDAVAEASGFGALQRFHIAFRRREKITPGTWRKTMRRTG